MVEKAERKAGQSGQDSGDLYQVRYVLDQHGNPCRVVDIEAVIREAERRDPSEDGYGNSPLARSGSFGSTGKHTKPRILEVDSP